MFAIIHIQDNTPQSGLYVAIPGSEKSYTKYLEEADIFKTQKDAEQYCCVENERVVYVPSLLRGLKR